MVSFCKIFQENQNFESWSPSLKLEYSHMLHVGLDVGLDFTYVFGKLLFTTVVGVNVQGPIPDTYLKSPDVLLLFTTQIYTDIPYLFYHNLNLQMHTEHLCLHLQCHKCKCANECVTHFQMRSQVQMLSVIRSLDSLLNHYRS